MEFLGIRKENYHVKTPTRKRVFSAQVNGSRAILPKQNSRRAFRVVHGEKELVEKLGRSDPCPCGSGRRFQKLLHAKRPIRRLTAQPLLSIKNGRRNAPIFLLPLDRERYGLASSTMLNGVSVARRTRLKPAAFRIFVSRPSPA